MCIVGSWLHATKRFLWTSPTLWPCPDVYQHWKVSFLAPCSGLSNTVSFVCLFVCFLFVCFHSGKPQHRNIVQLLAVVLTDEYSFIVMVSSFKIFSSSILFSERRTIFCKLQKCKDAWHISTHPIRVVLLMELVLTKCVISVTPNYLFRHFSLSLSLSLSLSPLSLSLSLSLSPSPPAPSINTHASTPSLQMTILISTRMAKTFSA